MKKCPVCKLEKPLDSSHWNRNKGRADGFNWSCRDCHRKANSANSNLELRRVREKETRKKDWKKIYARKVAKRKFGEDSIKCAVLNCAEKAQDLHHLDYDLPLDVVPLCHKHHLMEHGKRVG